MRGTVLLTGSRGFTGQYLRSELESEGFSVQELLSSITDKESVKRELSIKRPTAIIHLAAESRNSGVEPRRLIEVNCLGTLNLIEACVAENSRCERIIVASSATVYGTADGGPIAEDSPLAPVSGYGVSKLLMEHAVKQLASGLKLTITRPFNYIGRGQSLDFLVPKLVHHVNTGRPVNVGNTAVAREFNDVRDVAKIYCELLKVETPPLEVNICSSKVHYVSSLINLIETLSNNRLELRIDDSLKRSADPAIVVGNSDRLRYYLPTFRFRTLEETLSWMLSAPSQNVKE